MLRSTSPLCSDCGATRASHRAERVAIFSDRVLSPLMKPFEVLSRGVPSVLSRAGFDRVAISFFTLLAKAKLGTWHTSPDESDSLRTRCLWESGVARGIHMRQFRLFGRKEIGFLIAHYGNHARVFDGLPRPVGP